MVIFACVMKGNYHGRGADYVNILFDSVSRNMPTNKPFHFWCLSDTPDGLDDNIVVKPLPDGITGWWNKIYLFSDVFPQGARIVYLDLDVVVCGRLDEIYAYDGPFCGMKDHWNSGQFGSALMMWEAGTLGYLWDEWNRQGRPEAGGDQEWIGSQVAAERWDAIYPGQIVSFKDSCKPYPPKGTRLVNCHGRPKPHENENEFVRKCWTRGGIQEFDLEFFCNTRDEELKAHIDHALTLGLPEVTSDDAHEGVALLIGGGPSLKRSIPFIKGLQQAGATVFAMNNAARYLRERDVCVDYQVMLDARQENAKYVGNATEYLLASQCHPDVFASARGPVTLWHAYYDNAHEFYPADHEMTLVGGGTTVLLRSMCLVYTMGYRNIHLFGGDSSSETQAHAYEQTQSIKDADVSVEITDGEMTFQAAPWMAMQAREFQEVATALAELDCSISVHGDGLLPHVARKMTQAA